MKVRPASSNDAREVARLLRGLGYPSDFESVRERLTQFLASTRDAVLVADFQGRLVGVLVVSATPRVTADEPFARITALVVDSAARRQGVGRQLVLSAERWATSAGCSLVQVTSGRRPEREAAHDFYVNLGYQDIRDEEILYEKPLEP